MTKLVHLYASQRVSRRAKDGEPGKDAVNINLSPSELVYNADKDGNISSTQFDNNTSTVSATRGGKAVSFTVSIVSKDNCEAAFISSNEIKITKITTESVATGKYVPASAGGVKLKVTVDGTDYYSYLPFRVNTNTFVKTVLETDESFQRKYTEISNKYNTVSNELNGKASKDELREVSSSIEQTAREISLSVSEKSIGRRNLLVGSAFRRQEGFGLQLDANVRGYGILMNDGVDGMNCIKVASYYDGTRHQYCGAFWSGNYTKSIRIKHRTQYTFSCWVKVLDANTTVYLEVIYNRAEIGGDRDGRPTGTFSFVINEPNKWQLVKWSFTTDDTHDWIEANVFTSSDVAYKTFVARFCKPMLEEGDYNGWTLSEQDYDYVGGNMLDNTLSLDKSGSLYDVNGTLTPAGFGESTSIYKSFVYKLKGTVDSFSQLPSSGNVYNDTYYVRNDRTCYAYNGSSFENVGNDYYYNILEWRKGKPGEFSPFGLEANKDYVFSFMAKGTGKITAYFFEPYTDVFVESSLGAIYTEVDGYADFQLTNEWRRYWVHWRPSDSLHKYILLRLNRSFKSDGSLPITDCYIAQPKLEEGATMTEFTERKTDLVDKASLKKAGIGITDREVLLYGEQVKVMNGNAIAALFKDGMLNADLIAAKVLESLGSNGARVAISDGIMEFFGSVNKTKPNIRFGLNSEGSAVLSYYDNNGNLLYDLGPDGISTMDKTNGTFTEHKFYTSQNLFGVSSTPSSYGTYKTFTSSHNPPSISETFLVADDSYDSHLFPSLNPSTNTKTTLYRYTAPRINGKIVADSLNGFTTQELASKADGKYFTSKAKADVVKNGNLASLAPDGDYWNVNAGVVNQGNFQPAVLKLGEYYDKPTYSRALPMSLIAGSKELGIVGKICSKETTRQWGQGIQAFT